MLVAGAAAATAEVYPSKPVRFVVPFAPGGTTDILARIFAQKMGDAWGQSVIVENRTGAGGGLGAASVARAAPDGYTILMGTIGTHSVNPILVKGLLYHPESDFAPVTLLATMPLMLVVNAAFPATDLKELIRYAKTNPGKLSYASDGNGSISHLTGEMFRKAADIDIVHIPYRGSSPALTDLMAGQVSMKFDYAPTSLPYVRSGKLRAIAMTSLTRNKGAPDVPTVSEAGLPGFSVLAWWGIYAPKGTPADIVNKIRDTIAKATVAPDVVSRNAILEVDLVANTPDEFARFQHDDIEHWSKIIKEMKINGE
jgi:tripartite-type tricarboxylate transporter receptor subunit TctC